jgi:peptidoglycan/xylan/chitin deacetylase (PgdA/CDA1 family)
VLEAGHFRPVIVSPELDQQLQEITGVAPAAFELVTRVYAHDAKAGDDVVVRDADSGLPLVVKSRSDVVVNFDVGATRAFRFADSKRPVYTYLPGFNIQKVPEQARRLVSNFVKSLRSHRNGDIVSKYRTLPLTNFEFVLILLDRLVANGRSAQTSLFRWPSGKRAAFVSLHDIDSGGFLRRRERDPLFRVEQKHQIRSTWFIPSALLSRNDRAIDFLLEAGHEVGWHGHKHDHRDHVKPFADAAVDALARSRLSGATHFPMGMRAPRLLKSEYLFSRLERSCEMLRYDTSFLNGIVPYPLWLHGRQSRILEIPTTVPTDILLYNSLSGVARQRRPEIMLEAQLARTEKLIEFGGLISIVTHPEKTLSERPDFLDVYDRYLSHIRSRSDVWFTTAGELFKYWTGANAGCAARVGQERQGEAW